MRLGRVAAATDPGRKRRRNEDSYVVDPPLFAVADGMGGAQAGELASRLAVEALADADGEGGESHVAELIQAANRRVYERSSEDSSASGMGTTITLALVHGGAVTFGHVGDSRAYLIRGARFEQLTEDHSLVQELIRSGRLSPEEAETHPQRSVITRALGTDPDVEVDTFTVQGEPGDVFMLCSDGLTSMVDDDVILATVERHRGDLDAAAAELVRRANRGGGEDNITVVFFELTHDEPGDATEELPATQVAPPPTAVADDEDTLHGLERPAAVDTMVVSADEIRAAAAPPPAARPSPRPRSLDDTAKRVLATVAVVAVVVVIALTLWWGLAG